MPRPRTNTVETLAGGNIYIRAEPDGTYKVIAKRGLGQRPAERRAPTLERARKVARQLEVEGFGDNEGQPLWALADHLFRHLAEEKGRAWDSLAADPDGHIEHLQGLFRRWFKAHHMLTCRGVDREVGEAAVKALRAAGRSPDTEKNLRAFWSRLVRHGIEWGYLAPGRNYTLRLKARKQLGKVRGGAEYARTELPSHDQIVAMAEQCALRRGVWWEWLRILFLAYVGPRWGEHVALQVKHFDLEARRVVFAGTVVERRAGVQSYKPYLKAGDTRAGVIPAPLVPHLRRRFTELADDPEALVFPDPRRLGWQSGKRYRTVWLRAGRDAGWPVVTWRTSQRGGKDYQAPSALRWHLHELRHVCGTYLLSPRDSATPWSGAGLTVADAAVQLGDNVETVVRHYIGEASSALERLTVATDWVGAEDGLVPPGEIVAENLHGPD